MRIFSLKLCLIWILLFFSHYSFAGLGLEEEPVLTVDEAFQFNAEIKAGDQLQAVWIIANGHYLYNNQFKFELKPAHVAQLGQYQIPKGEIKQDEYFGAMEISRQQVVVDLPLIRPNAQAGTVELTVEYQGCAERGICYPPTRKTIRLALPAVDAVPPPPTAAPVAEPSAPVVLSEQDEIAQTLAHSSWSWIVLLFFGFGLALALTPCVFPMIPILSGIIVGQGELSTRKAFVLSLVYVLAMAVTYSIAGVLAGLFGANLQAALQNVWVIGAFSLIFVLLSLSMFGFYELQMPNSVQSKLTQWSNQQQGGTLLGVAIMGFLSALIVGPCVAAPLAGALIYIGQTGDALLGFVSLFAMSLGMGVPLLIIGTSAGKWLPRAGQWMDATKAVFGVSLLAVAVWMLERVLPASVILLLWAALLIVSAVYLHALDPLPEGVSGWRKFWKGIGVLLLLYGVLLVVSASAGGQHVWQPLASLNQFGAQNARTATFHFTKVKTVAEVEAQIATAQQQGKTVVLDFYADWCISCKEMEKLTFSEAKVQQVLAQMVTLQADVTANDAEDKALLAHFGLIGPPSLLFFNKKGEQDKSYQLVGFKPADEFALHVQRFLAAQ